MHVLYAKDDLDHLLKWAKTNLSYYCLLTKVEPTTYSLHLGAHSSAMLVTYLINHILISYL